jgi:hypothetical protein
MESTTPSSALSYDRPRPVAQPKPITWAGWIFSVLASLPFLLGAVMDLSRNPMALEGLRKYGYPESIAVPMGVVSLVIAVLYLVPHTALIGAALMTAYLGGAVATHVRASEPFFMPLIVGLFPWLGLLLRDPRYRALFRPRPIV